MLGVGVVTYNRRDCLAGCLDALRRNTRSAHRLMVADDGSSDDTVALCRKAGVKEVIAGGNRGVCWNKNRLLYAFLLYTPCDPIVLIEDDCWPTTNGWDREWATAAAHHHVGYAHPDWPVGWRSSGEGTADNPWLTPEMAGQVTVTSRRALAAVGYMDTRFRGYGFGHVEWAERFAKAGLASPGLHPCMCYGFELQESVSFCNTRDVTRNGKFITLVRSEPFRRMGPCAAESDLTILKHEISAALELPY